MKRLLRWSSPAVFGLTVGIACAPSGEESEEHTSSSVAEEPVPGAPAESRPLRQGFTQRPDPDTPGLPPPIPPFLDEEELERARIRGKEMSATEVAAAQREIASRVEAFERAPNEETLAALRESALELAKQGKIRYLPVAELYDDYLFPSPKDEADAEYKGKFAVFSGTVAPHNMKDFADGFKLVEQNPYVHDPLLLATDYELSFVECRLARPSLQKLRDWQPIHFVAEVEGKKASDVMLRRCIVL